MADLVAESRYSAQLREVQPAIVRCLSADGDKHDLAVPPGRKKWTQMAKLLCSPALPWVRAHLLNKDGQLLGILENGSEARAIEDVSGPDAREATQLMTAFRFVSQMQDQQLQRLAQIMAQMLTPSLHAMNSTLQILVRRNEKLESERDDREIVVELPEEAMPAPQQLDGGGAGAGRPADDGNPLNVLIKEVVKEAGPNLVPQLFGMWALAKGQKKGAA